MRLLTLSSNHSCLALTSLAEFEAVQFVAQLLKITGVGNTVKETRLNLCGVKVETRLVLFGSLLETRLAYLVCAVQPG